MLKLAPPALLLGAVLVAFPCLAQEETTPTDSTRVPVVVFPETVVRGQRIPRVQSRELTSENMNSARFTNASEVALLEPGVAGVRRNASQVEPVIRGLGWESVVVQRNHLQIFGACPGRMDPPLSYAGASGAEEVVIVMGLPSVTLGAAGTGGRVFVDSAYERKPGFDGWEGWLRGGLEAQRKGYVVEAGASGGTERTDLRASVEALEYGNYQSGDGRTVTAQQRSWGASLAGNWRTTERARWWTSGGYRDEREIDYPSLPMDLVRSEILTVNTGYRVDQSSPWQLELGGFGIDHLMDNARKANRNQLEASTTSSSEGASALARWDLAMGTDKVLRLGLDASRQRRDALRTRTTLSNGRSFQDHIWPDTEQDMAGVFTEWESSVSGDWRVRAGIRADHVESQTKAADDPALGGESIREAWIGYYGAAASPADRGENVAAGNLVASWIANQELGFHLGAGLSSRAAGITERYYAYAPAPGGFMVGNPSLAAEKKWELSAEVDLQSQNWQGNFSLYAHWMPDYILSTTIDWRDVNGDGAPDRIRGFENVDARLFGFDGGVVARLGRGFSLPMQAAYVWGENVSGQRALPQIPPAEARLALRYDWLSGNTGWIEAGTRLVAQQDRIDPFYGENETPGFVTFDLRAAVSLASGVWLDGGILNLLDRNYYEHLTHDALLPSGDLNARDAVPAPGISAYLTARYQFGS